MTSAENFTLGVEEEFFLVDPNTRRPVPAAADVLPGARARAGGEEDVQPELLQSQIEIGTAVCHTLGEVRAELERLRGSVSEAAAAVGCAIAAMGSHPFASHEGSPVTPKPAYLRLEHDYRLVTHEQQVCGCHVHVGVADPEIAIQVVNAARPWLPVLLALSANSPFWQGRDSGYASFRSEVWKRWPTAGTPGLFGSRAEYDQLVHDLLAVEAIDDPARIYWDVRPSARYDTVEFRVSDSNLTIDDSVMIAALVRALVKTCHGQVAERAAATGAAHGTGAGCDLARREVRPRRHARRPGQLPVASGAGGRDVVPRARAPRPRGGRRVGRGRHPGPPGPRRGHRRGPAAMRLRPPGPAGGRRRLRAAGDKSFRQKPAPALAGRPAGTTNTVGAMSDTWVCLLRGVNVGGKRVAMKDLKELFEGLGHEEVTTYIQSGNVVFRSRSGGAKKLAGDIQKAIKDGMKLDVTVLLRSPDDLAKVTEAKPFKGAENVHVTFLDDEPDGSKVAAIDHDAYPPDEFEVVGREVYLRCPDGYGRSKLVNSFWEKKLGVAATTRNWRTVEKLLGMASG